MTNVNYNFTENGVVYDFDDVFVSAEIFRKPSLWNWGFNGGAQLGINNAANRSTPVTTILGGTNWKSVSCGVNHTSAIKTDGTLWIWGANDDGQLGINATTNRSTPVTTILGGTNWSQISSASNSNTAIKTDGTLWSWGYNATGHLGINVTTNRSIPVTTILGGNNWKSVSCGTQNTTAIKTDGTLWVCGNNGFGQLGTNDTTLRSIPVTTILGGNNWKSVSCGRFGVGAIKTDGTLWLWGRNYGQLGVNDTIARSTPVTTILGGTNWKSVSSGSFHTGAIKTDGTLWLWGDNTNGQLGINATTDRSTPVTTILGGTNWKSVSCRDMGLPTTFGAVLHTIALKTDGTLWTWGNNSYGQLGINSNIRRSTPVTTILGGNNWKSVSSGACFAAIKYEPDP